MPELFLDRGIEINYRGNVELLGDFGRHFVSAEIDPSIIPMDAPNKTELALRLRPAIQKVARRMYREDRAFDYRRQEARRRIWQGMAITDEDLCQGG